MLYGLGIRSYASAIRLAAPFNAKAKSWVEGRSRWREKVSALKPKGGARRIWIHAASLGEFEQVRPVIDELSGQNDIQIVVTFFSPSGYEVRKDYPGLDGVFYLPIDTWRNARDFVKLLDPDLVLFVKYEVWLHFFAELAKKGVPTAMVSAIFRKNQRFFAWWGNRFRKAIRSLDAVFVQNTESAELIRGIGAKNVKVSGDIRFDQVRATASKNEPIERIELFKGEDKLLVIGSAWEPEIELVSLLLEQPLEGWNVLIAPHEIGQERIAKIEEAFPSAVRYSRPEWDQSAQVLIVDTIGLLSRVYRYADLAVVGGGFGTGLHNILEPAAFGVPVTFGNEHEKFPEASLLMAAGGAIDFDLPETGATAVRGLMDHSDRRRKMKEAALFFVAQQSGGTDMLLKYIQNRLR